MVAGRISHIAGGVGHTARCDREIKLGFNRYVSPVALAPSDPSGARVVHALSYRM